MKQKNITFVKGLAEQLSKNNLAYRFIDTRWKKRGDIDIIVSKKDISGFERILKNHGFRRKGYWPPQSRSYKAFQNNEILSLGAHVGGYIGGFGGGLGRLGKKLNPATSLPAEISILSIEERLFILLYKYGSRKQKQKYEEEYQQLITAGKIDYQRLASLCSFAFKNYSEIAKAVEEKKTASELSLQFSNAQKIALRFRGKPNKILKRLYKIIKPSPYIAIVGCNGSGKSTTVKNVVEKLRQENIETAHIYSGRIQFQMLPINFFLKLLKPDKIEGKKVEQKSNSGAKVVMKEPSKEQYAREVRIFNSPFLNSIAPFVYYVEYLLRYVIQVYPKRIFNDIVITDRGYIDLFTSPNMNKKVCRFFFKILPQPKHMLLWNDPKVLAQRRPEFRMEDLQKQLEAYDQFASLYLLKIKTDQSNTVLNTIAQKIEKMV